MWSTFVFNKKLNIFDYIKRVLKYYNSQRRNMSLLICSKYFACPNANRVQGYNWGKGPFIHTAGPKTCEEFVVDTLQNPRRKSLLCFLNWIFPKTFLQFPAISLHLLSNGIPLAWDRTTQLTFSPPSKCRWPVIFIAIAKAAAINTGISDIFITFLNSSAFCLKSYRWPQQMGRASF